MAVLSRIALSNFRNISQLYLDFSSGVNIFFGKNGQGKTNIIESIYLLTNGESFRPGKNGNFIRKEKNSENVIKDMKDMRANLEAVIEGQKGRNEVSLSLLNNQKVFKMNKKRLSSAAISKNYASVLFSSESLSAIKDGPDQRRQLIDSFLISHLPINALLIFDYKKCLRSRNKILKNFRKGLSSKEECKNLLLSINPVFLNLGVKLTLSRVHSLKDMEPFLKQSFKRITGYKNVNISVNYLISSESALHWNEQQINNAMYKKMMQRENSELAVGLTLVGPHRHDVQFLYEEEDSRYFCSQGEQRSLILSFKMAQIMYHYGIHDEYPILLLDDVLSELDESKRRNLIEFMDEIESQIFITTTDATPSKVFSNKIRTFEVKSGKIVVH